MSWKTIAPKDLQENPFRLIGETWTLVTAGDIDNWNTLTASWGGFGILWNRPVSFIFIRPTRHTFQFLESSAYFTLSFFDESWRPALKHIGTVSGRDHDKAAETGLKPEEFDHGSVAFEQARLVIVHRKIHAQGIDPASFVDLALEGNYTSGDYHKLFVGEIEKILVRD